jgi:hypothetical protein
MTKVIIIIFNLNLCKKKNSSTLAPSPAHAAMPLFSYNITIEFCYLGFVSL